MKPTRGEHCISDLRFDAWLAGDLAPAEREGLLEHVLCCARCRARQAGLLQERERFHVHVPELPRWFKAPTPPRPVAVRAQAWCIAAALSAAVALLLLRAPPPATTRSKGAEEIDYFVKRGGTVQRGARERPLQPGDQLRFTYTTPAARYLTILSLDGADRISLYYPAGGRAARIEPGVDVPLPAAVELDGTPGQERIFALFCAEPLAPRLLQAALSRQRLQLRAPAGCTLRRIDLTKQAPAP